MSTPSDPLRDRDLRQRDVVPPGRLAACHALVIGVGAIGRQVALQLAAVGVPRLTLFDHDVVQVENLAAQGYWPEDLGTAKVQATAALCRRINPKVEILPVSERFKRSTAADLTTDPALAVFLAVDTIGARKMIWEALRQRAAFLADGRMSAEVVRVLAVGSPATDHSYAATLFDPADAYAGPCTARSTIYTASVAAGLMVGQLAKWLRRLPVEPDVTLNLLAMELAVTAGSPS